MLRTLLLTYSRTDVTCHEGDATPRVYKAGSHKLFAYGCPDRGMEFEKRREKENCIIYTINTDPSP